MCGDCLTWLPSTSVAEVSVSVAGVSLTQPPPLVLLILGRWVECGAEYGLQSTYRGTAPANTSFAIRCQTSQDTRRMKVSQDLIQILLRVFCSGETSSQPAQ